MAEEVTQGGLMKRVTQINEMLDDSESYLFMVWVFGLPCAYSCKEEKLGKALSPRLPMGQMRDWLSAFVCGLTFRETDHLA